MTTPGIPVFDGHNDILEKLFLQDRHNDLLFFEQTAQRHLDFVRASRAGFAGGFFAIYVPPDAATWGPLEKELTITPDGYEVRLPPVMPYESALAYTMPVVGYLLRLERASAGRVKVARQFDDLVQCLQTKTLAVVLHLEGADAIDQNLDTLYSFYEMGVRSIGLVWSRPNAFGCGVPFKFPSTPDIGPGLTEAGMALVKACNQLGVMIDVSHLNEKGFWDVARLSQAPLVATHSAAHALCATARNLTDRQFDAIRDSNGVVGVIFNSADTRPDGRRDPNTPIAYIVNHVVYIAERIGIDHVALGSDFDGALIPNDLNGVSGLPLLITALQARGFDDVAIRRIASENWLRVLQQTWRRV